MIYSLQGILLAVSASAERQQDTCFMVLNVNGVGYQVFTTANTLSRVVVGEPLMVHTSLIVRPESLKVVGFLTAVERELFEVLQHASGIGVKLALELLGHFEPPVLVTLILNDDHKQLSKVKGVGQKVAQKLCLELKDHLKHRANLVSPGLVMSTTTTTPLSSALTVALNTNTTFQEATGVLDSLGYEPQEIQNAFQMLLEITPSLTETTDLEGLLKNTLQALSKQHV